MTHVDISADAVKELRAKTNAGVMDCKEALRECQGNLEKAKEYLQKKGIAQAHKKSARATKEGSISSYIHGVGNVGVLSEINCETDFVAKNEVFKSFARDINMHIAALAPQYVSKDQVPQDDIEKQKEIFKAQIQDKPPQVVEKIVIGKLEKYFSEICLLDQAFVKNSDMTVGEYVKSKIAELGENIVVRRFLRYQLGEDLS